MVDVERERTVLARVGWEWRGGNHYRRREALDLFGSAWLFMATNDAMTAFAERVESELLVNAARLNIEALVFDELDRELDARARLA